MPPNPGAPAGVRSFVILHYTAHKIYGILMAALLLFTLAISWLILTVGLLTQLPKAQIGSRLSFDPLDLEMASLDFGGMGVVEPLAVFHPSSAEDVARLVRIAYKSAQGFTVSGVLRNFFSESFNKFYLFCVIRKKIHL